MPVRSLEGGTLLHALAEETSAPAREGRLPGKFGDALKSVATRLRCDEFSQLRRWRFVVPGAGESFAHADLANAIHDIAFASTCFRTAASPPKPATK